MSKHPSKAPSGCETVWVYRSSHDGTIQHVAVPKKTLAGNTMFLRTANAKPIAKKSTLSRAKAKKIVQEYLRKNAIEIPAS
jgi:hypothetical protein